MVIYLGSGVLAYFAFGQAQFRALTWLFYNKASAYPLKADPSIASLLTLVFANPAFSVLLNLSMFFSVLGIISFAYTNLTRAWFVASFDRVLPAKLASVDDRFNIPWLTYVIAIVIGMILVVVQFFVPFWTYWYNSSVGLGSYWFITAVALMLFPFTRKISWPVLLALCVGGLFRLVL